MYPCTLEPTLCIYSLLDINKPVFKTKYITNNIWICIKHLYYIVSENISETSQVRNVRVKGAPCKNFMRPDHCTGCYDSLFFKVACKNSVSLKGIVFFLLLFCFGFNVALKHLRSYHDGACL